MSKLGLESYLSMGSEKPNLEGYLAAINDVTLAVSRLDLDEVLEVVYDRLSRVMDSEFFYVGLYDVARHYLHLKMIYVQGRRAPESTIELSGTRELTNWIVQQRQALVIRDFGKEDFPVERISMDKAARSAIFMPLIARDEVLGVLSVQSSVIDNFSDYDVAIIEAIAGSTAVAVYNAQLFSRLQQQLNEVQQLNAELQNLNGLREELVENMTHDLRAPLAFVRGYVSLMAAGELGPVSPEQSEALSVIDRKTDALLRLIDQLHDMERISSDTLHREAVDLGELLQQTVDGMQLAFGNSGVKVVAELPAYPVILTIDAGRINQVLDNLINNAVKYSQAGDTVKVRYALQEGWVKVDVVDEGQGMPPDVLNRIFDRFYQVPSVSKPGSGLGLAIVKQIIEAHHGKVEVQSALGQGSTFSFFLPYPEK